MNLCGHISYVVPISLTASCRLDPLFWLHTSTLFFPILQTLAYAKKDYQQCVITTTAVDIVVSGPDVSPWRDSAGLLPVPNDVVPASDDVVPASDDVVPGTDDVAPERFR